MTHPALVEGDLEAGADHLAVDDVDFLDEVQDELALGLEGKLVELDLEGVGEALQLQHPAESSLRRNSASGAQDACHVGAGRLRGNVSLTDPLPGPALLPGVRNT